MHATSPFIDTVAVEAWDAWFRWREPGRLRDISVEATWRRVATSLANAEPVRLAGAHESELMNALMSWRLLLDERVLATAGTGNANWPNNDLAAVVNAAMFVRNPFSSRASFDLAGFSATAELAVAALDNAASLGHGPSLHCHRFRIGVIGFADALELLEMPYGSAQACAKGGEIGRALAEGCFSGAVNSAKERGACNETSSAMLERAVERGMPKALLEQARRHGLRHTQLTAIEAHPRLSLFANNVADALDPLSGGETVHYVVTEEQTRSVRSSGYASNIRQTRPTIALAAPRLEKTSSALSAAARTAMHQALQPWIDEPIAQIPQATHAAEA
ncbi:MAG: hypothetical protein ABIS07_09450 [Dokdonella sp.]